MRRYFIPSIVCYFLISTACSNVYDVNIEKNNVAKEEKENLKISFEDEAIIKKYKDLINSLDFSDRILVDKTMKDSLSEISKIQNKYEREKIQMNIYLSTGMYQEAYELNNQQFEEEPTAKNLVTKCELMQLLKHTKTLIRECNKNLAQSFEEELKKVSRDDPLYIYGEWGYLLSMYKAGHKEYKQKMQNFINSTSDETTKFQFKNSYDLAIQQSERD